MFWKKIATLQLSRDHVMDTLYTKACGIKVCIINLSSIGWAFAMYVVFSRMNLEKNLYDFTYVINLVVEIQKS